MECECLANGLRVRQRQAGGRADRIMELKFENRTVARKDGGGREDKEEINPRRWKIILHQFRNE